MLSICNCGTAEAPLLTCSSKTRPLLANIYALQASFLVSFTYVENLCGLQDRLAGAPEKTLAARISKHSPPRYSVLCYVEPKAT